MKYTSATATVFLKTMALVYFVALISVTLIYGKRYENHFDDNNINLVPLRSKQFYLDNFQTLLPIQKEFLIIEITGNLLLFLPFSWAFYALSRKKVKAVAVGVIIILLVFAIESFQYIFHIGTFDIDDLILNISGGFVGIFVFKVFKKVCVNEDTDIWD